MMRKILSCVLSITMIMSLIGMNIQAKETEVKAAGKTATLTQDELIDKTLGGYLGKFAGVVWGEPTEAHYLNRMIPEEEFPAWNPSIVNNAYNEDDLYVMIPLLDAMYKNGLNCDRNLLADSYKNSSFILWHANAAARDNLMRGVGFPYSGNYEFNLHSDCLDWQITTDFIGQAYPGLINKAIETSFDVGHIMSYGDGTYGGVFVSAMHSAAYVAKDINEIINAGVNSVPKGSKFRTIIDEVMQYYNEGKPFEENWQLINDKWIHTDRCTVGVDKAHDLNIDAGFNSAFILMGLLYGEGDFEKSMKISMQCGQDSDCNPSNVGGIIGNLIGAKAIDTKWTDNIDYEKTFQSSSYTLQNAVDANVALAEQALREAGATFDNGVWTIPLDEEIVTPILEQAPKGPSIEMNPLLNNGKTVRFNANAKSYSNIKKYSWDFGDGTYGTGPSPSHAYETTGDYCVNVTVENADNEVTNQHVTIEVNENIANRGTPICSVMSPEGGGNRSLNIIKDGSMIHMFQNQQYDTYTRTSSGPVYFGYTFNSPALIDSVIYTEGMHMVDGGWFKSDIKVQVKQGNKWSDVELLPSSTPSKTANNMKDQGAPFEKFTFNFDPVSCTGVRIIGDPGGTALFAAIAELQVLRYVPAIVKPTLPFKDNDDIASSEINGDNIDVIVKDDVDAITLEFNDDVKAYVDPSRTIEFKAPITLKELITKLYITQNNKDKVITIKKPFSATYEFCDVPTDEWYTEPAAKGKDLGIILGSEDGGKYYFKPGANATRIESITMILRALGIENTQFKDTTLNFVDYSEDMFIYGWSNNYVKAATALEIMKGSETDGKLYLNGEKSITRKEFFTFLSRSLKKMMSIDEKYKDFDLGVYKDKDKIEATDWFVDEAKFLSYYKIVEGSYGMMNPDANITRSEIIKSIISALAAIEK